MPVFRHSSFEMPFYAFVTDRFSAVQDFFLLCGRNSVPTVSLFLPDHLLRFFSKPGNRTGGSQMPQNRFVVKSCEWFEVVGEKTCVCERKFVDLGDRPLRTIQFIWFILRVRMYISLQKDMGAQVRFLKRNNRLNTILLVKSKYVICCSHLFSFSLLYSWSIRTRKIGFCVGY